MSENVRVAVRVRPFNDRERAMNSTCVVRMEGNQTIIVNPEDKKEKTFAFDFSYWSHNKDDSHFATQDMVFQDLGQDVLTNAFSGYNVSLFAYGQTGAGKSYSMVGYGADKGIIPRACDELFRKMEANAEDGKTFSVEVSMLEIYNEKVRDLLNPAKQGETLKVRENPKTGPYVEELSKNFVKSYAEVEHLMDVGSKARTVAATNMNATSSRAHTVFTVVFTQTKVDRGTMKATDTVSKINLIDLAGSERVAKTGASGETAKQGAFINLSLTALGNCISTLAENSGLPPAKRKHIPYRDSVLTWLLKESLGGNAKTIMIAALSPAADNYEETLGTLRYADRAKQIKNKAVVNEDPNQKLIRELREEIERLRVGGGGGGGGAGGAAEAELRAQLMESQRLIEELSKSREQRQAESDALSEQRDRTMEKMGVGLKVDRNTPHFVNLNEDPQMAESLLYYCKPGEMKVGSGEACDMLLNGLGIEADHAVVTRDSSDLCTVRPVSGKVFVNGKEIKEPTELHQGHRVIFGMNHVFRFTHPVEAAKLREQRMAQGGAAEVADAADWASALRELAEAQGGGLLRRDDKAQKELEEKLRRMEEEKQAQMRELEEQMAKLQQQAQSTAAKEREEMERRNQELMAQLEQQKAVLEQAAKLRKAEEEEQAALDARLLQLIPNVNTANLISQEMQKQLFFEVQVMTHVSVENMLLPEDLRYRKHAEVGVRVRDDFNQVTYTWSYDKFSDRLFAMRDVYQNWKFYHEPEPEGEGSPFVDVPEAQVIGVSMVYVNALAQLLDMDMWTPIINYQGEPRGEVYVEIVPHTPDGGTDDLDYIEDPQELIGKRLDFTLKIREARGLPMDLTSGVYLRYKFFGDEEPVCTKPLEGFSTKPQFNYAREFTFMSVDKELLRYLQADALSIEVLGNLTVRAPDGSMRSAANTLTAPSGALARPKTAVTPTTAVTPRRPDALSSAEPSGPVPSPSRQGRAEVLTLDSASDDASHAAAPAPTPQKPSAPASPQAPATPAAPVTPQRTAAEEEAMRELKRKELELKEQLAKQEREIQRLREQAASAAAAPETPPPQRTRACVLL